MDEVHSEVSGLVGQNPANTEARFDNQSDPEKVELSDNQSAITFGSTKLLSNDKVVYPKVRFFVQYVAQPCSTYDGCVDECHDF